jgi:hypothetical protein
VDLVHRVQFVGTREKLLMAVSNLFAQISILMDWNTLFKNECCWLYAAAAAMC